MYVRKCRSFPIESYQSFCNVLHIWKCLAHPYLKMFVIYQMWEEDLCIPTHVCMLLFQSAYSGRCKHTIHIMVKFAISWFRSFPKINCVYYGGAGVCVCYYAHIASGFIQHDIVFKLTHAMIMLHTSVMNIIMLHRGGQAAGVLIVRLFNMVSWKGPGYTHVPIP